MNLQIEKMVYGGDGMARLPADDNGRGKAVFVPFVLPGEQIEATVIEEKPGFSRARAEKIVQPSPLRVDPRCPYFLRCGGCHYQHASYEEQLKLKAAILKENLRRIAKLELETPLQTHPSPAWNYRNRTRLKISTTPDFVMGYHQFGSHTLLPVEQCPISSPLINRVIAQLLRLGREKTPPAALQEIELFANADDTRLLMELYCQPDVDKTAIKAWAEEVRLAIPEVLGLVIFPQQVESRQGLEAAPIGSTGAGELTYETEHASFRVSAGSFFQVNRHLTNQLVTLVTAQQAGHTALDLYAGVGLFSAVLCRQFERVVAVESAAASYADLQHNGPAVLKTVRATVEEYLKNVAGRIKPDLVVVDPPRSGLGQSVTRSLSGLGTPRLTYVSCDPATLARDLGGLLTAGYRVQQAHLIDLFPQTYHLESVFHLAR